MTCAEIREQYSQYYDGTLDGGARDLFESHLASCPDCAADYASYRDTLADVSALPAPEPPAGFHEQLMRRLREAFPSAVHRQSFKPYAVASGWAAACFVLLCVLVSGVSGLMEHTGTTGTTGATAASTAAGGAAVAENAVAFDTTDSLSGSIAEDADFSVGGQAALFAKTAIGGSTAEILAAGYYEQRFTVEINVDDLQQAAEQIDKLNGYNVDANANYTAYGGWPGRAYYQRRVDASAYAAVIDALRGLGEVMNESESVTKLADEVYDLEARLTAKEQECARLMSLLTQSRTIDVLAAVERRLGTVEAERDDLRGQLNRLYDISARPYMMINLYERPGEPVVLPEDTFGERLRDRLVHSVNSFVSFMEDSAVFLSGAFVPLAVAVFFGLLVLSLVRRHARRRKDNERDGKEGL